MKRLSIFSSNSPWRFLIDGALFALPFVIPILYFSCFVYDGLANSKDLFRLGMIPDDEVCSFENDTLPGCRFSRYSIFSMPSDVDSNDVWLIGDSFAEEQGVRSFQNYMAYSLDSLSCPSRVFLIQREFYDPVQLLAHLLLVYDTLPQCMIVENVERGVIDRLCNLRFVPIYTDRNFTDTDMKKSQKKEKSFFENVEVRLSRSREFYKKRLNIQNPVRHFKLKSNLFSNYHYQDDLFVYDNMEEYDSDFYFSSDEDIQMASVALDSLYLLAAKRDVSLVFMVAPNKYTVYEEFVDKDVKFHSSSLERLYARYYNNEMFFNPAPMIIDAVRNGEKDMYPCSDTHWSMKSAKLVGDSLASLIVKMKKQ